MTTIELDPICYCRDFDPVENGSDLCECGHVSDEHSLDDPWVRPCKARALDGFH